MLKTVPILSFVFAVFGGIDEVIILFGDDVGGAHVIAG